MDVRVLQAPLYGDEKRFYSPGTKKVRRECPEKSSPGDEEVLMKIPYTADNILITVPCEAIKAHGDGVVEGVLVRFTSASDPDTQNEFFSDKTDFCTEFPAKSQVFFHHGLDPEFGKVRYGSGVMELTNEGVFIKAVLDTASEKGKEIYRMAEEGQLGWSSGSQASLVLKDTTSVKGQPVRHILQWPLGIDASLTKMPVEPRNSAWVAVKSLLSVLDEEQFKARLVTEWDGAVNVLEDLLSRMNEVKRLNIESGRAAKASPTSDQYRWRLSRILDIARTLEAELTPLPDSVTAHAAKTNRLTRDISATLAEARLQQQVSQWGL
jgi:hypothetical protein